MRRLSVAPFTIMKDESQWYYESPLEPSEVNPAFVWIERFYCFDWASFSAEHYRTLDQAFQSLPGWRGYGPESDGTCAYWYGDNEEDEPFLCAWKEKPYLQVCGAVTPDDLALWESIFHKLASSLPTRRLTGSGEEPHSSGPPN